MNRQVGTMRVIRRDLGAESLELSVSAGELKMLKGMLCCALYAVRGDGGMDDLLTSGF